MKQFILVLNGPMCAGKSTVTNLILEQDGIFRASYDLIKRSISNYSADNKAHREMAKKISFSTMQAALQSGLAIIIDGGFEDYREKYKELANDFGCKYVSVNIEAPVDILEKRFIERVESAKNTGRILSVVTLEGFYSRYDWYINKNKDLDAVTFNSSVLSPEEIAKEIMKLV